MIIVVILGGEKEKVESYIMDIELNWMD